MSYFSVGVMFVYVVAEQASDQSVGGLVRRFANRAGWHWLADAVPAVEVPRRQTQLGSS